MADTPADSTIISSPHQAISWRRWLGLAVMLSGTFMAVLDAFIVNIALPNLKTSLGASFAELQFVIVTYGLAYAVMLITGGRLGDIFGRRRTFMLGMAGFTLTSLACGLAPDATTLILARIAQGLTAAIMSPQVFAMMRVGFPHERERAIAFACLGIVYGLSSVAGQLLGGFLVEANFFGLEWRPVFLVNLPLGLFALIAAPFVIKESRNTEAKRLDLPGVTMSAAGLLLLLYPLIEGREAGWPAWAFGMLALSLPVLGVFAWDQQRKSRRHASPLLEMRLFRNPVFAIGILAVFTFVSTQTAFYLALTVLLQNGLGASAMQAGLVFAPLALAFTATSVLAGRFAASRRYTLLIGGAAIVALSFAVIALQSWRAGAALTSRELLPALTLLGFGAGFFMTPLLNAILSSISGPDSGAASGMITTMQQTGSAFGIAIVGILFFGRVSAGGPEAFPEAMALASLYGALGCGLVCLLLAKMRQLQHRV